MILAFAAYVLVFTGFAVWRWHIWTYGTDTGTFTQVIADAFGGFRDGPEQGTHLRFHWAPLLASLWPLVTVARSGLALQIVQPILIGLTAFPLYGIARSYVDERGAFAYASLALLYPPLAAVAFTEFHEIAFYPVLALAIFWAAERARWGWFALFAILAAVVREEACIVLAIVGVAFAVLGAVHAMQRYGRSTHGRPVSLSGPVSSDGLLGGTPLEPRRLALAGVFLAVVNVAALLVYAYAVLPRVGPWQPSRFYEYPFAHGPLNVLVALGTHPIYVSQITTLGRLTYVLEALVPLAFLPLFSRWSLLALPGFAVVLLASDQIAWRMGSHYAAIWCPWLLLGALAVLLRRPPPVRPLTWYRSAFGLCIAVLLVANPMHIGHYLRPIYPHADAQRALALVPRGAHLLTHDEWFTRVAYAQRNATVFFCPYVNYVVYADDYPGVYYHTDIVPELARERASGQLRLVATFGHVHAYRRTPDPGARVGRCITPGNIRYRSLPQALRDGS
ncbi:MAG: DUF2079 domain-containing protein [Candidatus Eremiobacteraeota bacterium]|nr:DUF2079 domain-containing protein [Candidatus Eremiobacteraeota bacterium]